MRQKIIVFSVVVFSLFNLPAVSQFSREADLEDIISKLDELYRSESSVGTMEMEIVTPHWERTLKMKTWTEGMDKTFIRILEPKKERGMATLRIENEMWNYLPKVNKVIKVPPSMMMSSWMGSDFTNDDLVKEFTFMEDYDFELTKIENPEPSMIYIKCIPHKDVPIVWGYVITAVRDKDYMPVWQKYYDENRKLMRKMLFKDIKRFGSREIPSVMELIPLTKSGHKTTLRYLELNFNVTINDSVFSLRNLRSRF
ncbi:MAG: outer membrane lipoprotein-sorting protein [Candidatus Aminicenantaceae bacterium]